MAKKITSVLGVDIGSQKIKIAEVKMQGKDPVISAIGMIDTPQGAVDHTGVYETLAVGGAIKELAASIGATAQDVVVSIAGQMSVLVRTLEVPRMNAAELKEHMQWEITRNVPFAESTIVSDFRAYEPRDPAAQNLDVVMAISPQSAIDALVAVFKAAARKPAAIDVEPLALARSLKSSYDDAPGQTICIVEIGHKTSSINMYDNGELLLPRQVMVGGEQFTRAIEQALNIPFEEAQALKHSKGAIPANAQIANQPSFGGATEQFTPYNPFADDPMSFNPALAPPSLTPPPLSNPAPPSTTDFTAPTEFVPPASDEPAPDAEPAVPSDSGQIAPVPDPTPVPATPASDDAETTRVFQAMAGALEEFIAEIRRSVDYFRSKGGDVAAIRICGGGSLLRGLPEFIQTSLGVPCSLYDPLQSITVNAKKLEPGLIEGHAQEFGIAVGNGLYIFFE